MNAPRGGPARPAWLLPLSIGAAVLAVTLAVVVVRPGDDQDRPPVLHLTGIAKGALGLSLSAVPGSPDRTGGPSSSPAGSGWQLDGTLPDGPASARVHLLAPGESTGAFVTQLAGALGRSGVPQHLDGGWYLAVGTSELSVSELAGQHWTYADHGCLAGPVLDPQTGTACAVATPGTSLGPKADGAPQDGSSPGSASSSPSDAGEPTPVPESVARAVARPVLEAVGVDPEAAQVETAGGQRSLVFRPVVAGAPVFGLETRVAVDERGRVVDASGWLAAPTAGASYPLVTARQAYEQLLEQPQPLSELGMPCQIDPRTGECPPAPARVVTGAALGLAQAYGTGHGILLVPAWLFQVRDEPTPVAVVAVDPAFLGAAEPPASARPPSPSGEPGSAPGSAGSESGGNGTAPTATSR